MRERDQKMMAAIHQFDKHQTIPMLDQIIELERYDPATVLVYRPGDLERAKRDLQEAEWIAALLTVYLNRRFWQVPTSDPERERVTSMRDALFKLLCEKRLFRESLGRTSHSKR
jgi:hypothetical protein